MGGYYGKGKRTNVYGAFLLACYDSDSEEFQTICKIGTGFSEEVLQSHYETLKPLELTKVRGDIKIGGAKPDIWFEPTIVWEVLTADLSLSPIYTAAKGLVGSLITSNPVFTIEGMIVQVEDRGISLRFPRFVRIREDKSADDATGPEQVSCSVARRALMYLRECRLQKCMSVKHWHRIMARKRRGMMPTTVSGNCSFKMCIIIEKEIV